MTFGEKLQKLRRTAGMSQEQLAEQLEVSRQAVSKWELGDSLPDAARILTLSRKFGVSADYLLKDELEEPAVSSLTGSEQAKEEGAEKSCAFLPPAPQLSKKKRGIGWLITAAVTGGVGGLGFLVVAILSSMIESRVDITYQENGTTWYTSGPGYSFTGFVEKYRLGALLWVFGTLIAAALVFLWVWLEKRQNEGK